MDRDRQLVYRRPAQCREIGLEQPPQPAGLRLDRADREMPERLHILDRGLDGRGLDFAGHSGAVSRERLVSKARHRIRPVRSGRSLGPDRSSQPHHDGDRSPRIENLVHDTRQRANWDPAGRMSIAFSKTAARPARSASERSAPYPGLYPCLARERFERPAPGYGRMCVLVSRGLARGVSDRRGNSPPWGRWRRRAPPGQVPGPQDSNVARAVAIGAYHDSVSIDEALGPE